MLSLVSNGELGLCSIGKVGLCLAHKYCACGKSLRRTPALKYNQFLGCFVSDLAKEISYDIRYNLDRVHYKYSDILDFIANL